MRYASLLLLSISCTHHHDVPRAEPALAPTAIEEASEKKLEPLGGEWLEKVGEVSVSVPLGATEPRPLVVAAHGAGDRPEWACGGWRGVIDAHAFIACPHGSPWGEAFAWSSLEQIEERVRLAEQTVRDHWPAYVDGGPIVLVGFSQGSRLVSVIARKHPDRYPVVALLEGGYEETQWGFGPAFAKGGKRILFSCSTYHCAKGFEDGVRSATASKVDARLADLGNLGHHMGPSVTRALREQWRWLVRDDERWEAWLESDQPAR